MDKYLVEIFYLGDGKNQLLIHADSFDETYQVYWHMSPEPVIKKENFIFESNKNDIIFDFEYNKHQRVYFVIDFGGQKPIVVSHRILQIPGMYNFRDLGGYPVKDNKRVKWGLLYRGDHLFNLMDDGVESVESLNIKTIIDFRSKNEIEESPNPSISTVKGEFNFSPEGAAAMFAGALQNMDVLHSHENLVEIAKKALERNPNAAYDSMINQQQSFVQDERSIVAFSSTLKALAEYGEYPSYQHCRGGKDRTGYASMLLLALLGVDQDYLVYDYMLTNRAREKKNQRYLENYRIQAQGNEAIAQYLFAFFDVKKDYILAAINSITDEYGTIENYVRKVLKLSDDQIEKLRNHYLE